MTTASGMELIEAIRSERADAPEGIRTLGLDRTHRWITELEPGRVTLMWPYDPAYANLEGAVICSWIAALGDQAIFFASNSLCASGEGTRMAEFAITCLSNIEDGDVVIRAQVDRRVGDRMFATCTFHVGADRALAARMSATLEVLH